jgi:RNA polymerase sigma-70 factor (ECF subfamily)
MRRSHRVSDQRRRVGEGVNTPEEFSWLFAQEYRAIVRSVDVVLHDHARAEEITQDAFVRLLESWGRVSRYDRPGAWVRRVAIRLATKHAARERRRGTIERAGTVTTTGPSDLPDVGDRHDALWEGIRSLPPRQRAVVALYYLDDMPVSDVADIVGCSESTVSVHLHRARQRLAELVGEEVVDRVDR